MDEIKTCEQCRYWEQHEDTPRGLCRRKTPDVDALGQAVWPTCGIDDWCGAFGKKKAVKDDRLTGEVGRAPRASNAELLAFLRPHAGSEETAMTAREIYRLINPEWGYSRTGTYDVLKRLYGEGLIMKTKKGTYYVGPEPIAAAAAESTVEATPTIMEVE